MASFIRTGDHLTIVFDDGVSANISTSDSRYAKIREALSAKDYELARTIAFPAEQVVQQVQDNFGEGADAVSVEHGIVRYKGKELHGTLADRMVQMLEEGFNIAPLKLFLINLHQNPSYRAVNELYAFLERGNLPITDDGHFLAYKKVRANYMDVHSGTYDNSVGKICEMARNEVDEDSRNECSNGLHFCSRDYLSVFSGERIMIVKINPRDVVAIPADYNMSKGRTCRYEVIGELEADGKLEGAYRDTRPTPPPAEVSGWHQTSDGGWVPNSYESDLEEEEEDEDEWDWDDCDFNDCGDPLCDVCGGGEASQSEEIPTEASSFAGLPGEGEPNSVPRDVIAEIANELDRLDLTSEEDLAHLSNLLQSEPVIAVRPDDGYGTGAYVVERFDDIKDAAAWAGVTPSAIRRVLRGDRKTTGGYEWRNG